MRSMIGLLLLPILAVPMLAGALRVEIDNPAANPEAQSKNVVLLARTTACHSPEKTVLSITAEGLVNGSRQTVPLKVVSLSPAGTFGIARAWPPDGTWVIKIVARNPEYKNYSTSVLVPVTAAAVQWSSATHDYHEPTEAEVAAMLHGQTDPDRASLK